MMQVIKEKVTIREYVTYRLHFLLQCSSYNIVSHFNQQIDALWLCTMIARKKTPHTFFASQILRFRTFATQVSRLILFLVRALR